MSCCELPGTESFEWSFDYFDAESDNAASASAPASVDPLHEYLRTVSGATEEDTLNVCDGLSDEAFVPVIVNINQEQEVVDLAEGEEEEEAYSPPSYNNDFYEISPRKRSSPLDFDRWGKQPSKGSIFDMDHKPVSDTSAILDHCLEKLRSETEEQIHVLSAMEALAADRLFFDEEEPPLKRIRRTSFEEEQDEDEFYDDEFINKNDTVLEEEDFELFLCNKISMHTLELSAERIGMQNARLRPNLGMTREQAPESMAAEFAGTPKAVSDDEDVYDDTDSEATEESSPKVEMDEGTLSFLKKYIR